MHPYFSIILPIYNVATFLDRCIQSILKQDMKDYEIILVDDGSTDESPMICDRYTQKYDFIRTIHKENGGLSSARNVGLDHALGQYIWWVDSDDWIESDSLRIIYNACRSSRPDIVKFNYYRLLEEKISVCSNLEPGLYSEKAVREVILDKALCSAGKFTLSAWSHVYRREFLEDQKLRFVSERTIGSEDYLFNLCAFLQARSMVMLPQLLYVYVQRSQSLSQSYQRKLPERYNVLYGNLKEYYRAAGYFEKYEKKICYFYIWHLLRGTCLLNEYVGASELSMRQRRLRVRCYLKHPDTENAAWQCKDMLTGWKNRIILWAMRKAYEPILYGMFYVWPRLKKGMKQ